MAPQASKKCELLPFDHHRIGVLYENGRQFETGVWQHRIVRATDVASGHKGMWMQVFAVNRDVE